MYLSSNIAMDRENNEIDLLVFSWLLEHGGLFRCTRMSETLGYRYRRNAEITQKRA